MKKAIAKAIYGLFSVLTLGIGNLMVKLKKKLEDWSGEKLDEVKKEKK